MIKFELNIDASVQEMEAEIGRRKRMLEKVDEQILKEQKRHQVAIAALEEAQKQILFAGREGQLPKSGEAHKGSCANPDTRGKASKVVREAMQRLKVGEEINSSELAKQNGLSGQGIASCIMRTNRFKKMGPSRWKFVGQPQRGEVESKMV